MSSGERLVVSVDFHQVPFDGDRRFITAYLSFLNKEIDNVCEGVNVLNEKTNPTPEPDTIALQIVKRDETKEKVSFELYLKEQIKYKTQHELHLASVTANESAQENTMVGEAALPLIVPDGIDPGDFVYKRDVGALQRVTANEQAIEKMRKVSAAALKRMEETLGYAMKTKHVKILNDISMHPRQKLLKVYQELKKLMESNCMLISSIKNDIRTIRQGKNFKDLEEIIGEIDKFNFQIATMSPCHQYSDNELISIIIGDKAQATVFNHFRVDWSRRERNANREISPRSLTWDEFKEEICLNVDALPGATSITGLYIAPVAAAPVKEDKSGTFAYTKSTHKRINKKQETQTYFRQRAPKLTSRSQRFKKSRMVQKHSREMEINYGRAQENLKPKEFD